MKATVYYVDLTREQTDELNDNPLGWASDIGKQYLAAKKGQIGELNMHLLRKAAVLEASDAEQIWERLQNTLTASWTGDKTIEQATDFPRSMDVGDLVVWEDGRVQRCADMGFYDFAHKVELAA